jgi:hypothetical protein
VHHRNLSLHQRRQQSAHVLVAAAQRDAQALATALIGGHLLDVLDLPQPEQQLPGLARPIQQADEDFTIRDQLALHLLDVTLRHQFARLDDADVGTNLGHVGQDVRREEDRLAHLAQFDQQLADFNARARVQAGSRLI